MTSPNADSAADQAKPDEVKPDEVKGPTEWNEGRHGVGPWEGPLPQGPEAAKYDPELLAEGDRRNVVDAYRYWSREAIKEDIDKRRHSLHIAIENFENDANIGTVVRTANAFAVDTVHIVGRRRWNRRGAMVTDRYQHLMHHESVEKLIAWAAEEGLTVVAIDNTPGCVPLETAELPERSLLLFGQEGPGVTQAAQDAAVMTCSIAQFGSTRSINAGVAAGIAMHAWIRQHADLANSW
ncbi:TrmH family RNA methyltransferase [Corynebacterium sp. ACRPF]|uniref:TrmH family RNA methyltransferase n=1 Tax=Corynebacterium sp. ACRPF TaxID=2918197 RepID=UPI001EF21C45|nr:TrmH family RNA methyltransferase [Corynebacterium sp. ACRPF]MCG7460096.1 RNA methyltransferase [Corynebacterium sp. ACRPF]